jgi:SAM-dependent methyltransferase
MDIKKQMDDIYGVMALDEIPWNLRQPPWLLVELVESGSLLPCDAVDLGCGAGNQAVWLAKRGFEMTCVDISPKAIEHAEALAAEAGIECRFVSADLTKEMEDFDLRFDFAYDWEVLHHIFPPDRERYAANVHRMLRPGGRYLSVCFGEQDFAAFEGEGKYRKTPLGTTLYFSSLDEIRELFDPLFIIDDLRIVEIAGKYQPHMAIMALMKKKE